MADHLTARKADLPGRQARKKVCLVYVVVGEKVYANVKRNQGSYGHKGVYIL